MRTVFLSFIKENLKSPRMLFGPGSIPPPRLRISAPTFGHCIQRTVALVLVMLTMVVTPQDTQAACPNVGFSGTLQPADCPEYNTMADNVTMATGNDTILDSVHLDLQGNSKKGTTNTPSIINILGNSTGGGINISDPTTTTRRPTTAREVNVDTYDDQARADREKIAGLVIPIVFGLILAAFVFILAKSGVCCKRRNRANNTEGDGNAATNGDGDGDRDGGRCEPRCLDFWSNGYQYPHEPPAYYGMTFV